MPIFYVLYSIKIEDFHYHPHKDNSGQVVGLVAQWHQEKSQTIRGKEDFCLKWFARLSDTYDFYDIDPGLAAALEVRGLIPSFFHTSRYLVLKTEPGLVPLQKINGILYIRKEELPNIEHLTLIKNGKPVSSMSLERVTDRHFILSRFATLPNWRNQGIGAQFLETVLNRFCNKTVRLFVDANNNKVISFYKRFGFVIVGELYNFERPKENLG